MRIYEIADRYFCDVSLSRAVDQALRLAQELYREGELEDAAVLFAEALALRPRAKRRGGRPRSRVSFHAPVPQALPRRGPVER